MPVAVSTFTLPVLAPLGTVVLISELETILNEAGVPLKVTLVALGRLFPRITTAAPTSPEVGSVSRKPPSPVDSLKTVPPK
jgi:hypothetical protein